MFISKNDWKIQKKYTKELEFSWILWEWKYHYVILLFVGIFLLIDDPFNKDNDLSIIDGNAKSMYLIVKDMRSLFVLYYYGAIYGKRPCK